VGEAAPLPFTAKADLVGVHRGVARTEFALREGNDLEELGNLFPVELFEFYPVSGVGEKKSPSRDLRGLFSCVVKFESNLWEVLIESMPIQLEVFESSSVHAERKKCFRILQKRFFLAWRGIISLTARACSRRTIC
jgi:hypothetical protein